MLSSYKSLDKEERARYGPYTSLCNASMVKLKDVSLDFLRPPNPLNIRLNVNDQVVNPHSDVSSKSRRKPDVVMTSKNVTSRLQVEDHAKTPEHGIFQWPQILRCDEFKKAPSRKRSDEATAAIQASFEFKSSTKPGLLSPDLKSQWIDIDDENTGDTSPRPDPSGSFQSEQLQSSLKRKLEATTSSHSHKKPRKDSVKTSKVPEVSARVQVATYALESMENRGIQYVFEYLFISSSACSEHVHLLT